jgi:spore photoproduct lyase
MTLLETQTAPPTQGTIFDDLDEPSRNWIGATHERYRFTNQELRQLCEHSRDLQMWGEQSLASWWDAHEQPDMRTLQPRQRKSRLLAELRQAVALLQSEPTQYAGAAITIPKRAPVQIERVASEREVFGDCPVRSERTLCCNLKTIDAVTNCGFGCSYCTIQTFYGDRVTIDAALGEKLRALELDAERFYHIGTGQSSDSLLWGNNGGLLDELFEFAERHPNVLLEFKTKSANTSYFIDRDVPANIVCSWSLNTETLVTNEEHFTASLDQRLAAARRMADRGIAVAFHFHPMVHYAGWQDEYQGLARRVQGTFDAAEVKFLSFGSVTFIKPVIKQIRRRGEATKILQAELVRDPHGKLTYTDDRKVEMFSAMYGEFAPWEASVFMYLCMEKPEIWDRAFGWRFASNEEFEASMGRATLGIG